MDSKDRFIKLDTTITGYFLAKDLSTYLLKTLPKYKHREYVKCLVDGRINLYTYSLNNFAGDSAASLYASKGSNDLVRVINAFNDSENNEKKFFTDLISDDPNLCEKVKNNPCNFTAILNYVKIYNGEYLTNNKPAK